MYNYTSMNQLNDYMTRKEIINLIHALVLSHDILGSIKDNVQFGKISPDDASRLQKLTGLLLHDLYEKYEETKEVCDMYDQSLILDVDEHIEEKERLRQELKQTNEALSKMEAEMAQLKAELAKRN